MKRSFLSSQSVVLSDRPLVVGTLTSALPVSSQLKTAKSADVDLIELRLDGFLKKQGPFQRIQDSARNILREIKTNTRFPILLTLRAADESGVPKKSAMNDAKRAEILARLLPAVQMVDVEISHAEFARRMTVIAHIHNVDVIHSAHDFSGRLPLDRFSKFSKQSIKFKGDVFKVAVTPKTNDDLEKFLWWGKDLRNRNKVLIGMGPVGLISRVVAFSFGSILTYGHLGRSAAPGQMPVNDLVKSIRNSYPPLPLGRG